MTKFSEIFPVRETSLFLSIVSAAAARGKGANFLFFPQTAKNGGIKPKMLWRKGPKKTAKPKTLFIANGRGAFFAAVRQY